MTLPTFVGEREVAAALGISLADLRALEEQGICTPDVQYQGRPLFYAEKVRCLLDLAEEMP